MEQQHFLDILSDLLNVEVRLALDTNLKDIEEWDSLGHIMFLVTVMEKTGKKIEPEKLKKVRTVRELYNLVHTK